MTLANKDFFGHNIDMRMVKGKLGINRKLKKVMLPLSRNIKSVNSTRKGFSRALSPHCHASVCKTDSYRRGSLNKIAKIAFVRFILCLYIIFQREP